MRLSRVGVVLAWCWTFICLELVSNRDTYGAHRPLGLVVPQHLGGFEAERA
jgi:hypothetical protein